METSQYRGTLVTVVEFLRRRTAGERTTCPACQEELFVHSVNSVVQPARFSHRRRQPGEPTCILSNAHHPDYSWLTPVPDGVVTARAEELQRQFYTEENIARAFRFLVKMAGAGAITRPIFALLLNKANKLGVWSQSSLPVWAVPYLLLTLIDFVRIPFPGKVEQVRFILIKPRRCELKTLWHRPEQCRLERLVVRPAGIYRKAPYTKSSEEPIANPLPFSEANFLSISADHAWVSTSVTDLHKEVAQEPEPQAMDMEEAAVPELRSSRTGGHELHRGDAIPENGRIIAEPSKVEQSSSLQRHETSMCGEKSDDRDNVIIANTSLSDIGRDIDGIAVNAGEQIDVPIETEPYTDATHINVNLSNATKLKSDKALIDDQSFDEPSSHDDAAIASTVIPGREVDARLRTDASRPTKLDEPGPGNKIPNFVSHNKESRLATDERDSKDKIAELPHRAPNKSTQPNLSLARKFFSKLKSIFRR